MPSEKEDNYPNVGEWHPKALSLIHRQKTLVLSTSHNNQPWVATVFYVFVTPSFYFFSSPRSKHIQHAQINQISAAALYENVIGWEQIEGLQLVGRIKQIEKKIEKIKAMTQYLKKFPFARKLLYENRVVDAGLITGVDLYAFIPVEAYYTNNLMGFGSRLEIDLQTGV